jgi:hypothetical protein
MGKTKRAEFASQWGAAETMLLEFEVVLAGIRGPDIIGQSSPSADRPTATQV